MYKVQIHLFESHGLYIKAPALSIPKVFALEHETTEGKGTEGEKDTATAAPAQEQHQEKELAGKKKMKRYTNDNRYGNNTCVCMTNIFRFFCRYKL